MPTRIDKRLQEFIGELELLLDLKRLDVVVLELATTNVSRRWSSRFSTLDFPSNVTCWEKFKTARKLGNGEKICHQGRALWQSARNLSLAGKRLTVNSVLPGNFLFVFNQSVSL